MRRSTWLAVLLGPWVMIGACAKGQQTTGGAGGTGGQGGSAGGAGGTAGVGGLGGSGGGVGGLELDAGTGGSILDPDAACATALEEAQPILLPVDIIWMVDNSGSMQPAIAEVQTGLNDFASIVDAAGLDYRVVMLSLRSKTSPVVINGGTRYPVCIPPPLAGDDNCGNGPRFFQSSIDIRSTQPLEQFLGTLGQTAGYTAVDEKGGEPWKQFLRVEATKTMVVVTDDNARLVPDDFLNYPGGQNPFNSLTLPPGILDPSWGGLFDKWIFDGIYGWGSDVDPGVLCTFPDQTQPASPGPTYTQLVQMSNGVRAQICDGAAAWGPFFDAVAQAVVENTPISCELAIPMPSTGSLDYGLVNVELDVNMVKTALPKVADAAACNGQQAWYYDDPLNPTKVLLCPAACDQAQANVGPGKDGKVLVLFGCQSITA